MDNFNIDKQTMDKLNSMLNNGNLNDMLSQIPPDTLKNFSTMMNGNTTSGENTNNNMKSSESANTSDNSSNHSFNGNFDFSKIDMNTMMKISSMLNNINNKDDPRTNLIYSLKPYLRDSKKEKIDQYANLLNITKMADLFKNMNPEQQSHD